MNVLFVAMDMPYPPRKGQRMRNWALLRALAEEGHDISLVSFADAPVNREEKNALLAVCKRVEVVSIAPGGQGNIKAIVSRLRALASPLPYGPWRFRSPALTSCVRKLIASESFEFIIWDEAYNLINVPSELSGKVHLNSHDVMRVIWERYLTTERNLLKRLYARIEYRKVLRWEPKIYSQLAGIITCSDNDAVLYRNLFPKIPVTVAANSVDTRNYSRTPDDDGQTLLFVGGMDWFPNRDGVEFFIAEVLPELRQLTSAFKFVVVGRVTADIQERFKKFPEVHFTGVVPDIRVEIARSAVCVVPLRIGSGVRWKILEAAAMGKAMVSTTVGVEGLEFRDGTEITIADHPRDFARSIANLLSQVTLRKSLGSGARQRVEAQYDFSRLRESIRLALGKVRGVSGDSHLAAD